MIKSMTAFARAEAGNETAKVTCELRSVNHRYLELGFKMPEDFRQLEPEMRKQVSKVLERGKVDISFRYKLDKTQQENIHIDVDIVRNLRDVEQQVLNVVHEGAKLSVADILGWPGVISEEERDFSALGELAVQALQQALNQLVESREAEGRALEEMISSRCTQITDIVSELREHRPGLVKALREKWEAALQEKLGQWKESASESRLEQELVMLAQKLDVEEELDRLDTHVVEVTNVLKRNEAVGRRLDFLMQELNREANTLGSKSQESQTTQLAVDLKVLIEQMREQVQNIE